jgi:recombination protein RecA
MAKTETKKVAAPAKVETAAEANANQLTKYLNAHKAEHFNFVEDVDYEVSSGSLKLDIDLGLFRPGLTRLVGPSSAGKSSFALNVAKNFLATVPKSRVVYVKAEGRLSTEIQDRSGLLYTKDPTKWEDGKVFIFESNVYEVVIGLIRDLITNNPEKHIYMFILDSMDGLNLRGDMTKTVDEVNRVAGAPLMTKQFLQKVSVAMTKMGHLCFFLSQISTEIKLDAYSKGSGRQVSGSGGNAAQHFASIVLEFQNWYEGDLLLEDPEARVNSVKNKALGHMCKIKIVKADREKRYYTVEIPIKHEQHGGGSIWREREIGDMLLTWQLVKKAGSWLSISETLLSELRDANIATGIPEKVQGMNQLYALLEERKDVSDYLYAKFKTMAAGGAA